MVNLKKAGSFSRKLIFMVLLPAAMILPPVFSFGLKVPERPEARVSDWAGLMTESARNDLESILGGFEEKTGNQIAVATFPSIEGDSLESFSIRLADKWKIGQKGKDNGIILLIFKEERLVRIEVGYGLEGVLPDAEASQIIRNIIAPRFRQGDYDGGITSAVQTMIRIISGENVRINEENGSGAKSYIYNLNARSIQMIVSFILLLIGLLLLIDILRYAGYASANRTYRNRYGFIEWMVYFGILLAFLKIIFMMISSRGYGGGRGGFGSSGGGFGGGGGSFGGGGSSGSW